MEGLKKVICFFVFFVWSLHCLAQWPLLPVPENSRVEVIGENVMLNGVPMKMHRIVSKESALKLEKFYQQHFGIDHTETEIANGLLLAQEKDGYFTTVRIVPMNNGLTEILTSVSDGKRAKSNQGRSVGFVLPAQSRLVMDMESMDAGKSSRQLVFNNEYSMQTNVDFMVKVLKEKGYVVQPKMTVKNANSMSLMFEGNKREARLMVMRDEEGSSAVLTTILSMK